MLEELKREVCAANLKLVEYGLVVLTWGNVSAITADRRYVVIKPSGVAYESMTADSMVVVDMEGNVVEGDMRPSSDLATHLELYRAFDTIGAVVHTHSSRATAYAQAERGMPCYGTTHADSFYGSVPCTRPLTPGEIAEDYERYTGKVIIEAFRRCSLSPEAMPAILVNKHGPFTWGSTPMKAVDNALVLEQCAYIALMTELLSADVAPAPGELLDKHYLRKHGENAYYGQKETKE